MGLFSEALAAVERVKNPGDVIAGSGMLMVWLNWLPHATTVLLFIYALMRVVNEWATFSKTVRGLFKRGKRGCKS